MMEVPPRGRPIRILLVEDSPLDAELTREVLAEAKVVNEIEVAGDGVVAMERLSSEGPPPDLILLDLNLPRMNGLEVLAEMRSKPRLATIPVVVLTTSGADEDVLASYSLNTNAYIRKPVDLTKFVAVVRAIESFWLSVVELPRAEGPRQGGG